MYCCHCRRQIYKIICLGGRYLKNKQVEEKLQVNHNKASCKQVALNYITRSMRSCLEVSDHLKKKEYSSQEIQDTIKFMEENKFIDDRNYTEQHIRYGISKGKGLNRIKQELLQKGIDDNLIKEVYEDESEEFPSERERAMEQARKILRMSLMGESVQDEKFIGKIARRLANLGYSVDSVYYVVEKIRSEKNQHD